MKPAKREQREATGKNYLEYLEGVEKLPIFMGFFVQVKKINLMTHFIL